MPVRLLLASALGGAALWLSGCQSCSSERSNSAPQSTSSIVTPHVVDAGIKLRTLDIQRTKVPLLLPRDGGANATP